MRFDRLAAHYRWLEAVTAGSLLQRARTTWLDAVPHRARVLSVGEGHGRFAAAVATRRPDLELTCLEASAGMLQVGQRRDRRAGGHATWLHVDAETWTPTPRSFDAIATHFFLDCFPPDRLAACISRLAEAATSDALWLHTDFAVPATGLPRWRARTMHACMYAAFRLAVDLPAKRLTPPDDLLRRQGFTRDGRVEFSLGLVQSDLWRRARVRA